MLLLSTALLAEAGSSSSLTLHQAQVLLQRDHPQQAIDLLRAHTKEIEPVQLHLTLGSAYMLLHDVDRARGEFEQAVVLGPDRSDVHQQYGRALLMAADLQHARTELEKAAALDPSDAECLYDLGVLDGSEDQPEAAVAMVERAIALSRNPERQRIFQTTAGQMYLLTQNWTAARDSFQQALTISSNAQPALVGLGTALEELALFKDAEAPLKKAVALNARDARAWEQLGRVETSLGDCRAAVTAYSTADSLHPDDRSLLSHLAKSLTACGRKADAAIVTEHLKAIVDNEVALGHKGPELAHINAEAISLEEKGDYQSAEQDYRRLTIADPENPIFHRNLGLVICRQARWSEGLAELSKALSLDPDDAESKRALLAADAASKAPQ